jgi:hypothetical protein
MDELIKKIRYIGKKPRKSDNVTNSNIIWTKPQQVKDVPVSMALRLLNFPSIWCEADTDVDPHKGESHKGVELVADKSGNMLSPEERVKQIYIGLVNIPDGIDLLNEIIAAGGIQDEDEPEIPVGAISGGATNAEMVVEMIPLLEENNPDHYTAGGLPQIPALALLTGITDLSAKDRDDGWEIYQRDELVNPSADD